MTSKLFCSAVEAERILATIPDMTDLEKLSWYVGYLEGQVRSYEVLYERKN